MSDLYKQLLRLCHCTNETIHVHNFMQTPQSLHEWMESTYGIFNKLHVIDVGTTSSADMIDCLRKIKLIDVIYETKT